MENIPPHFHKEFRIEERDLIPNGQVLSALPVSGVEGERVVVVDGGTYTFYQYLLGDWRPISSSPLPDPTGHDGEVLKTDGVNFYWEAITASTGYIDYGNQSSAATFNLAASNKHMVTLTGGPVTLALSGGTVGQVFLIRLIQDGSGSRTVTWFSNIKWPGGVTPILTTTAGKIDVFGFACVSSGNYDGFIIGQNL